MTLQADPGMVIEDIEDLHHGARSASIQLIESILPQLVGSGASEPLPERDFGRFPGSHHDRPRRTQHPPDRRLRRHLIPTVNRASGGFRSTTPRCRPEIVELFADPTTRIASMSTATLGGSAGSPRRSTARRTLGLIAGLPLVERLPRDALITTRTPRPHRHGPHRQSSSQLHIHRCTISEPSTKRGRPNSGVSDVSRHHLSAMSCNKRPSQRRWCRDQLRKLRASVMDREPIDADMAQSIVSESPSSTRARPERERSEKGVPSSSVPSAERHFGVFPVHRSVCRAHVVSGNTPMGRKHSDNSARRCVPSVAVALLGGPDHLCRCRRRGSSPTCVEDRGDVGHLAVEQADVGVGGDLVLQQRSGRARRSAGRWRSIC